MKGETVMSISMSKERRMLGRQYSSGFPVIRKRWLLLAILSVIALACASCSDTAQQTFSSGGGTVQPAHIAEGGRMPLTDSAPPQLDATSTVPASPPQKVLVRTTPTPMQPTSYGAGSSHNPMTDFANRRQGSNGWFW